jgi:hypothetical protein
LADDWTPLSGGDYTVMLAAARAKLVQVFPRVVVDHGSEVAVLHLFMDSVCSVIYQAKVLTPGLAALFNAVDGPNMANASLTSRFEQIKLTYVMFGSSKDLRIDGVVRNSNVITFGQAMVGRQMEVDSTL